MSFDLTDKVINYLGNGSTVNKHISVITGLRKQKVYLILITLTHFNIEEVKLSDK